MSVCVCVCMCSDWKCVTLRARTGLSTCLQVLVLLSAAPLLSIRQPSALLSAQLSSCLSWPDIGSYIPRLLKLAAGRPSRHLLSVLVFLTAVNRKFAALTFLSCSCSSYYYSYYITVPASATSVRLHVLLLLLIQHT